MGFNGRYPPVIKHGLLENPRFVDDFLNQPYLNRNQPKWILNQTLNKPQTKLLKNINTNPNANLEKQLKTTLNNCKPTLTPTFKNNTAKNKKQNGGFVQAWFIQGLFSLGSIQVWSNVFNIYIYLTMIIQVWFKVCLGLVQHFFRVGLGFTWGKFQIYSRFVQSFF